MNAIKSIGATIISGVDLLLKFARPVGELADTLSSAKGIAEMVQGAFEPLLAAGTDAAMGQINKLKGFLRPMIIDMATRVAEPVLGAIKDLKKAAQELVSNIWKTIMPESLINDVTSVSSLLGGGSDSGDDGSGGSGGGGSGGGLIQIFNMAMEVLDNPDGLVHLLELPASLQGVCALTGLEAATSDEGSWEVDSTLTPLLERIAPALGDLIADLTTAQGLSACLADPSCGQALEAQLDAAEVAAGALVTTLQGLTAATNTMEDFVMNATTAIATADDLIPQFEAADAWASALTSGSTSMLEMFQKGWCTEARRRGLDMTSPPAWMGLSGTCDTTSAAGRRLQLGGVVASSKAGFMNAIGPVITTVETIVEKVMYVVNLIKREGEAIIEEKIKPASVKILSDYIVPFRAALRKARTFVDGLLEKWGDWKSIIDGVMGAIGIKDKIENTLDDMQSMLPIDPVRSCSRILISILDPALPAAHGPSARVSRSQTKLHLLFSSLKIDPVCQAESDSMEIRDRLSAARTPSELISVFPSFITNFGGDISTIGRILGNLFKRGLDFSDIFAIPTDLMSAFAKGICLVQRVVHSMRAIVLFGQDKLYALIDLLSFGTWASPALPDCTAGLDKTCLAKAERSSWIYRMLLFPVQHLQFWDASSPPLVDPCRGLMKMKWTVPGLLSRYSLQSATFWAVDNVVRKHTIEISGERMTVEIQCTVPTYLLAYKPNSPKGCTGNARKEKGNSSLFVIADGHGNLKSVQELQELVPASAAQPTNFDGSATGIAVSNSQRLIWICSKESTSDDWNLVTYPKDGIVQLGVGEYQGQTEFPKDFITGQWRPMRSVVALHSTKVGTIKDGDQCWLSWDPERTRLWVGFSAPGDKNYAYEYEIRGREGRPAKLSTKHMVGPYVSGITWFRNMFGDRHLAVSRCMLGSSNGPCQMEFHNYTFDPQTRMPFDLNNGKTQKNPTMKMSFAIPRGIGTLAYDASVGVEWPQYFMSAYVGTTAEHVDKTKSSGAPPEDRIFLWRAPILQTGYKKSEDSISVRIFQKRCDRLLERAPRLSFSPCPALLSAMTSLTCPNCLLAHRSLFDDSLENLLKGSGKKKKGQKPMAGDAKDDNKKGKDPPPPKPPPPPSPSPPNNMPKPPPPPSPPPPSPPPPPPSPPKPFKPPPSPPPSPKPSPPPPSPPPPPPTPIPPAPIPPPPGLRQAPLPPPPPSPVDEGPAEIEIDMSACLEGEFPLIAPYVNAARHLCLNAYVSLYGATFLSPAHPSNPYPMPQVRL